MSPFSHPSPLALKAGTHALCSCGLSQNAPFCYGSHQGSGQAPHILRLDTDQMVLLCNCGASANTPFCDGSHQRQSA